MLVRSWLVTGVSLSVAAAAGAQTPVGALAIDERRGDQYGWAVDYETPAAARAAALRECGAGCSVVLTFARCGAYAADQDAASTAVGWAESFDSAASARQAALSECGSRGGSSCTVRVWGCNGPVVEEGLDLNQAVRRQIQQGLRSAGFDPGGADGLFGPRTRAAIRSWQSARGVRSTGYLDGSQVEALRGRDGSQQPAPAGAAATDAGGVEVVFWQSIQNSTNPAEFEAYLRRFPNGVFSELAQARLTTLGSSAGGRRSAASGAAAVAENRVSADPAARIRADETCAGKPAGVACWKEVSQRPGCHAWSAAPQPGATVTWTGECAGGFAQGTGTLTWVWDGDRQTETGRLVDGKTNGHWVIRFTDGTVSEGPFVDGKENGHWVWRYPDGYDMEEGQGPYVDGKMHGDWVIRRPNGDVEEWLFRDGERVR